MYLKLKRYDQAVHWSQKAFESYLTGSEERSAGRQVVTTIIIHLAQDDSVAAQKAYMANKGLDCYGFNLCKTFLINFFFKSFFRYIHNDERWTLDQLFKGLDHFDNDAITSALKSPFFANLDNELVKIIRDLLQKYQPKKSSGDDPTNVDNAEDDEAGAVL